jgi:tetratricopeptide (TPR) repeat protein
VYVPTYVPSLIPSGPQQSPERRRCAQLAGEKNWPELRTFATAWAAKTAGDAIAWTCLGYAEHSLGNYKAAIDAFRKSLDIDARAEPVVTALGASYLADRQLAPSIDMSKRALAIKPDDGAALRNLATAYHFLGKFAERDDAYQQLKRADPQRAEAFEKQFLTPPVAAPRVTSKADSAPDETVTAEYRFVLKPPKPGEPISLVMFRTSARNGTLVICRAFFVRGESPAAAVAYQARVDAPASVLEFRPVGEPLLDVPTAGAPVHLWPAPPDTPISKLKVDGIRNAGLPSRCVDTRQPWSDAFERLRPNPILADAP